VRFHWKMGLSPRRRLSVLKVARGKLLPGKRKTIRATSESINAGILFAL